MKKGLISFESPEQFTIADFERIQVEVNKVFKNLLPFVNNFFIYGVKERGDNFFHSCSFEKNELNIHIRILKTNNPDWETFKQSLNKIEIEKMETGIGRLNKFQFVAYESHYGFEIPLDDYEKYSRGIFFPIFFEIIPEFLSIYSEKLNSILNFITLREGESQKIVFLPNNSISPYSFGLNSNSIRIYVSPNFYFHFKQLGENSFFQTFYLDIEKELQNL